MGEWSNIGKGPCINILGQVHYGKIKIFVVDRGETRKKMEPGEVGKQARSLKLGTLISISF